jgi:hypothetical protein
MTCRVPRCSGILASKLKNIILYKASLGTKVRQTNFKCNSIGIMLDKMILQIKKLSGTVLYFCKK